MQNRHVGISALAALGLLGSSQVGVASTNAQNERISQAAAKAITAEKGQPSIRVAGKFCEVVGPRARCRR